MRGGTNLVLGDDTSCFPINHMEQRFPIGIPVGDGSHEVAMEWDGQTMPMEVIER